MSRRPRGPLLAGLALFAVFAALAAGPALLRDRTIIAATPTLRPLLKIATVRVPPRGRLCIDDVVFSPEAQAAAVQVRVAGRGPGPALRLSASAPGYRATGGVAGGYPSGSDLTIAFGAAPREIPGGALCLRNTGSEAIALLATAEERSQTPSTTLVNGRAVVPDASVTLVERDRTSALSRAGEILGRIAAFRPVGTWLLWPLALAVLLGVPAAVLVAVVRAGAADDDRAEGPRG